MKLNLGESWGECRDASQPEEFEVIALGHFAVKVTDIRPAKSLFV